ncbi:unnamed protein product [Closterium sp. NIES-54]
MQTIGLHQQIPCLRSMASRRLVSGLPRVFASLPPSPTPPCTPCVVGCLRATPHSSSLRPATAPFQTLHLDVWGPAPTQGHQRKSYFLVVVDDFSRYTTMFPLAKKSEVTSTLIWWLLATEGTRGRRVSCLHSGRGGEFRSGILHGFYREQGILQSWTLPESPQQNGVAERRIGLVMDIARTSMIHALSYYTRYPCRGPPVPPPPLFLAPYPPPAPAPPVPPPPLGPAPSGVSHATPLPSVTRQVTSPFPKSSSQSPQQPLALPRQVTVDSWGVGAGGADTGGARSGGAHSRGAGAGGASSGGAGARGASTDGASYGASPPPPRSPSPHSPPHRLPIAFPLRRLPVASPLCRLLVVSPPRRLPFPYPSRPLPAALQSASSVRQPRRAPVRQPHRVSVRHPRLQPRRQPRPPALSASPIASPPRTPCSPPNSAATSPPGPPRTVQNCPGPSRTAQDCPGPPTTTHDRPKPSKTAEGRPGPPKIAHNHPELPITT